ncbi:MAG: hypothetical protein BWY79_00602 [Actinobacteria bacterium ADurb.Bin444]|nr:MAG: hypothetical protein BWY79_00602 [Actinobacteria bacterium ADurb.Bin444]
MDEVLVANTTSGPHTASSCSNRFFLASISSRMASTTKSASAMMAASVEVVMRPMTSSYSAWVIFSFDSIRPKFLVMMFIPRWMKASCTSITLTLKPLWAANCTIPAPMVPAPHTPMVLMSSTFTLRSSGKRLHW